MQLAIGGFLVLLAVVISIGALTVVLIVATLIAHGINDWLNRSMEVTE
jgi:hypothetical protein